MKRIFDILLSLAVLILLSPIMLIIFILVRINFGKPVFFKQSRLGLREKNFAVFKFRTMNGAKDSLGILLPDEQRLTHFGHLLRKTSLDELPQLWNILKGDMSFIGPRPLLIEYLPLYNEEQKRRHSVKPGITGWAQVNGRNNLSWEEKFKCDVWYVDHQSFFLDVKILWLTFLVILRRAGISNGNHATMPLFKGSNRSDE